MPPLRGRIFLRILIDATSPEQLSECHPAPRRSQQTTSPPQQHINRFLLERISHHLSSHPPGQVHSTPLHLPSVGCSLLFCLLRAIFVTSLCDKVANALPQRTHALFSKLPKSGVLALTCSLSVDLVDFLLVSCHSR